MMKAPFVGRKSLEQTSRSDVSVSDIGLSLRRRWRWIAVPVVLAFVGSTAFVAIVAPRYTGEAKILLQATDSYYTRPGNSERYEQQPPQIDEQAVASQVQIVMSRDLAREAIRRLGLVGNAEFDPQVGGLGILQRVAVMLGLAPNPMDRPPEERVLEKYYDNLLVYPVGKSRIVSIEFRSKDADLASRAANAIAELYLGNQEEAKKDQARSASTWLGTNIDGLRSRVAEAEAKVEAFRSRTGLLVGTGTTTISAQQLSELSAQLAQARAAQSDAQAKARLIRETMRDSRTFDIPDVGNNELIRRLLEQRVTLRTQLALEQRTLLPQHPRIKELNAQLNDLEIQVRMAAERTVRMLENDSRIAGSRVESIESSLDQQSKIVSAANGNEVQLRALEREARIQREQLESYLGRYRDASARDSDYGVPPDARIVSRAVTPQIPSFPKKIPIVALSTLAALLLSIGSIVSRELLIWNPETDVLPGESGRETPEGGSHDFVFDFGHLGPNALLAAPPKQSRFVAAEMETGYDFAELLERLQRQDVVCRGRRIVVTGIADRADVVRVSRGLAQTVAAGNRVILIEADADETSPVDAVMGLTDLVAGEAGFAEVISRDPASAYHRVSAGTLMNEALTGSPESLELALQAFDSTYDWVVCAIFGDDVRKLLEAFAPRVDGVVLASNLEPASPILVEAYERVKEAGAKDVVVAREHPAMALDEAA